MEDTLRKFIGELATRHEENSNLIKEIRASTDAAIRNQGASIKTLEIQIGQMSKKGSYGPQFLEAYSKASQIDESIPQKEKDPGSFTLPCFINNVCFDNALVDLGASVSVMPLLTYLNLGLGELAHTKLTVELADRTVKYPKGIAKNVLVRIGKFTFPIDFIILDMPEDIKVPLILGRPFLSTARAKIDVYKRKITLRVGEENIIFKSVKPASSLIKRVYMLNYIELNDLNEPFKLRRNQGDDLMPTIEEGRVIEEFRTRDENLDTVIDDYPILKDMDAYRDEGMGDDIVGKPLLREVGINARRFDGMIITYNVIMEYLVNISKRRAFWSINEDILKITILKTNTPYPSRKIQRIRACTHQRPQRNKAQYAVSREDQYAVLEIWNEYNILEDIKRGPYSKKSPIRRIQSLDTPFFKKISNEMNIPAIVYNDAQTSKSDLLTEQISNPQHIDEFNLKDETSLSECDEEEQNVLNLNDLFPFNVIFPDELKTDKDNDNEKVDIEHSLGDLSVKLLPDVINTDVGAYAHGSNKLLETSVFEEQEIEFEKVVEEPIVSVATTTKLIPVSTAKVVTIASASVEIPVELTLAQTLIKIKTTKPKPVTTAATTVTSVRPRAKGIIFHDQEEQPEVPLKKKDQVALDEEIVGNYSFLT
ncbi:hypothetical protein Tco_1209692 [Tanacetum coccineum]